MDYIRLLRGYTHWKEQKEPALGCSEVRLLGRTTSALRSGGTVAKKKRKQSVSSKGSIDMKTVAGQCAEDWGLAIGPAGVLRVHGTHSS